jgi:nucleoside-diphosphate-sugar epimerase
MANGVNPEVLIIGCGFLGEATADLFSAQGKRVLALVRSEESLSHLASKSFDTLLCDVTDATSVESLRPRLHSIPLAIYAVSSGGGTATDYAALYRDGVRRVIESWQPQKLIFVSSTSVYAQEDGSWVSEDSPTLPERETARILLEAEQIALNAGGSVARFSGIYGPGRSLLLRKFLAGEAVLETGVPRYLNHIHRDDGAKALLHLGQVGVPVGIYNVSDDMPTTQPKVIRWIADFLKSPLPPEGASPRSRKRGTSSKRISNAKLRSLGWAPRYPSYKEALPELVSRSQGIK